MSSDRPNGRYSWIANWTLVCWISMLSIPFVGCNTKGVMVNEVTLPLAVVRKLVMENIPGGTASESLNGREITSEYFNPKNLDDPSDDKPSRAKAIATILGSRRPYQIQVKTVLERRLKGSKKYAVVGENKSLTKKVRDRLKQALANRPADINVIDDFRAF